MGKSAILLSIFFLLICSVAQADCIRCSSRLVCTGETTGDVAVKCGQPSYTERVQVDASGNVLVGNVNIATEAVDVWYYNCGEGRFNRTLYFRAGVLDRIVPSGIYGTGPVNCE